MKLFGAAIGAALLVACIDQSASAATGNVLFNGTITATLPQRQDEVHASDGTTCRSAVSGSGAYLDVGVIRGNSNCQSNSDVATYGRVVIPIGRTPKRVDCSRLYELEVERLQLELKLLKMGIGTDGQTASVAAAPAATSAGWADEGWSIRTGNGNGKKKKKK